MTRWLTLLITRLPHRLDMASSEVLRAAGRLDGASRGARMLIIMKRDGNLMKFSLSFLAPSLEPSKIDGS